MTERLPHGETTLQEIAGVYPALAFVAGQTLRLDPVDPETADWLDGPAFVKWLRERGYNGYTHSPLTEAQGRKINRWEHGGAVSVYEADQVLTVLGLTLSEIPPDLWIRKPVNSSRSPISPGRRGQIVARFRRGESADLLAREFGVSAPAIRQWAREG